jgi:anti-sigma regulatory factor (Ser/Thr protein kinase)
MECLSACPLSLELAAEPASVAAARHAIAGFVAAKAVDEDAIALAVSEAVSNAILHAYRDDAAPGRIRLRAGFTGPWLRIEVSDDGVGMRPRTDSPGLGLGLPLIAQVASHVDITSDSGTSVRMDFAVGGTGLGGQ